MKKTLAVLLGVLLLVACKSHPVVLNIGSAGSAKYPIGTIVNCTKIFNGDGSLKDWRSILADIRVQFTELLNSTR